MVVRNARIVGTVGSGCKSKFTKMLGVVKGLIVYLFLYFIIDWSRRVDLESFNRWVFVSECDSSDD